MRNQSLQRTVSFLLFFALFAIVTQTVAIAGPQIDFDYSYDTNGFFTTARRELLQEAASTFTSRLAGTTWARVDTSQSGGSYELAFINPSTLEISWLSNVIIPENKITIYVGATNFRTAPSTRMQGSKGDGALQLLSLRNISGGIGNVLANTSQYRPINASIAFDLGGVQGFGSSGGVITRQWHFDSDGNLQTDDRDTADPHFGDYTDFYDTAIHEIGHVLGIYDPEQGNALLGIDYDPGFCLAYTSQVRSDGAGGYVFTGTNAAQHYFGHVGQNIPLDTSTKCHVADGVRSDTADGWISVSYDSNGRPFRVLFSDLEFAMLQDLGYSVSNASCTYSISSRADAFASSSALGSVTVTPSSSTCPWTATSNDSWVTVISGNSGTGSGPVAYRISDNTSGSHREGTITIGGETFTIRQAKSIFTDDPNNVFSPYMYAIYTDGITVGCGSGKYCPSDMVTRGQMAAFIIRAKIGETFDFTRTPYFSDVPSTHDFFKYVQKMKDDGLTAVTGRYMVDDIVTREQMAAFIIRAKFGETFDYTRTPFYSDVPSTSITYFKYVQKMKDSGITTVNGRYMAADNVTRDQMAAFLARAFLGMQ